MGERRGGRGRATLTEIDSERDGGYVAEFAGHGRARELGPPRARRDSAPQCRARVVLRVVHAATVAGAGARAELRCGRGWFVEIAPGVAEAEAEGVVGERCREWRRQRQQREWGCGEQRRGGVCGE